MQLLYARKLHIISVCVDSVHQRVVGEEENMPTKPKLESGAAPNRKLKTARPIAIPAVVMEQSIPFDAEAAEEIRRKKFPFLYAQPGPKEWMKTCGIFENDETWKEISEAGRRIREAERSE